MFDPIIQTLMSSLGAAGFGLLFNVHGKKLLWIALGGGLNWSVYLLVTQMTGSLFLALFWATVIAVLIGEILARILKVPVVMLLVPMLIPLVPGGSLYYMMDALVREDYAALAGRAESLAVQVGAIAVGLIAMTSIMGNFFTFYYRRKAKKNAK